MAEDDAPFGADFAFDSDEEDNSKERRTLQSEDDFVRQKSEWRPKLERKEVKLRILFRLIS